MAITQAPLTSGSSTTNASSYATASHTPTGNRLVFAAVISRLNGAVPNTPTATGNGLTWVQVTTVAFNTIATARSRLTVFRGMVASPSAGATTFDFAAQTQGSCAWSIKEFASIDTGGTDGSAAVVQSATNSVDASVAALVVTLAAFGSADNATYGAFGGSQGTGSFTPGAGFTEIHDVPETSPAIVIETEWRNDNDTSVDATPNASADMGGIAIEIKAAVAAAGWGYLLGGERNRLVMT